MIRKLSLSALAFLLTACSMVKVAPQRFVVEKRWVRNTFGEDYLEGRRIHRFSPVLTENLVITANSVDGMVAYDPKTAHQRWRLNIKDGVESGAVLAEGLLYFGAGDGQFYAIQPDSGTVNWTYPLKAEGIAKPLVRGGVVYVLGGNNVAHALDAKTGKLMWLYNRREATNISVRGGSQPALVGDKVLIGFSDGALVALNKSSGAVLWEVNLNRNKRFRDVEASPVIDGDMVYVSSYDGSLYAIKSADGKIVWTFEDGGYDEVLIQGDKIFYSTSSGKTVALEKTSGKLLWSRENKRGIATAPVLYRGVLMVGEMAGALDFLDARNGEFLTSFDPGRGVTSKVTLDQNSGNLYFMSLDANIFALHVEWKRFAKDWAWE